MYAKRFPARHPSPETFEKRSFLPLSLRHFINVGAYVDEYTMIDSHALVGSCAQIGKHVHVSAGAQIGGVLEPVGAFPVIIEDRVLVGGTRAYTKGRS